MINKKFMGTFAIFIVAALFLVGCTGPTAESDTKTVHIGSFSRAIDYAPYIVAKNNGLFEVIAEKYDVEIDYVEFQSLPAINEAMGTNNLDIVFEAEPPAIIGRAAGIDLKIVSPGVSLIQEVLVPSESDVQEIAHLKGKKIAVPSGSSSHYGLNAILAQAELGQDDVEIIDMNPQDGQSAFITRDIDAWAIWPPFVEQQEFTGEGRVLRGSDVFIQSIVVMRTGFLEKNPEMAKDMLSALHTSQKWIVENTEAAQAIVAKELDIELEVVELAWGKHDFNPAIGADEIADMQNKADFLFDMELVKTKVDVESDLVDLL